MMISKGVMQVSDTRVFNVNMKEWKRLPTGENMVKFKLHFHQVHQEIKSVATTEGQGCYTTIMNNAHVLPDNT